MLFFVLNGKGSYLHLILIIWFSNKCLLLWWVSFGESKHTQTYLFGLVSELKRVFYDLSLFRIQWRVKIHFWVLAQCVTHTTEHNKINCSFVITPNTGPLPFYACSKFWMFFFHFFLFFFLLFIANALVN